MNCFAVLVNSEKTFAGETAGVIRDYLTKHGKTCGVFYDYAEIFLLRKVSIKDVWESLNQLIEANAIRDCMKTAELKGYQITVKHENMGYTWTAFIQEMEEPKERPEVSVFRVMFPQYSVKNGTPETASMNRFLTEIEKLFLRLDPDTLVRSQRANDTSTEN